jgi:hypothetical protein
MSKHTPKPWIARKGTGWVVSRTHEVGRREGVMAVGMTPANTLVSIADPWFNDEEAEANAHLIAAAPELLEALKRAQRFIAKVDELHQTIYFDGLDEECQAAIAKAEGPQVSRLRSDPLAE